MGWGDRVSSNWGMERRVESIGRAKSEHVKSLGQDTFSVSFTSIAHIFSSTFSDFNYSFTNLFMQLISPRHSVAAGLFLDQLWSWHIASMSARRLARNSTTSESSA